MLEEQVKQRGPQTQWEPGRIPMVLFLKSHAAQWVRQRLKEQLSVKEPVWTR